MGEQSGFVLYMYFNYDCYLIDRPCEHLLIWVNKVIFYFINCIIDIYIYNGQAL